MTLGTTLGTPLSAVIPSIEAFSIDETPIRIVIECVDSGNSVHHGAQRPIIVLNTTTGATFKIDTDMVVGDTIEIDSKNMRIRKNETDITHLRML